MRVRSGVRRVALLSVSALVAAGLPAVASTAVARATANANVHLGSSVTSSTSNPVLGLTFVVDKADVTPGDTVAYTAKLTNTGSEWQVGGKITAQAVSSSDAVIASWYDELDYRDSSNHWLPIAAYGAVRPGYTPKDPGAAVGGLTVAATPVTASGVTYPTTGDLVLGTAINAAKTASWTHTDSVVLTSAQIIALVHASSVRSTVHVEVTPRNSNAAQPATDTESLSNPLRSGTSATITNASVTATLPDASTVTLDKTKVAALASIAAGATVSATTAYKVPVPGVEKTTESDGTYLARLRALMGTVLTATASAKGTAAGAPGCSGGDPGHHYSGSTHHDPTKPPSTPANAVATGIRTVTSTEHLPVLSLTKTGPATVDAGTTATYTLTSVNSGDAAASGVVVSDTLPDGSKPAVTGIGAGLAVGATANGAAAYAVPASQPHGPLADTATLTWTDANHNPYGPLSASFVTAVQSSYAGASLSLSPTTAGPDVVGTSQTLTAVLTSASGAPLAGKSITISVTGTNPTAQTLTTDAQGSASLSYAGALSGDDTVQAKLVSSPLASNTATVSWIKPTAAVETTTVTGRFYPFNGSDGTFGVDTTKPPAFSQEFPNIDFNPPSGTVGHDRSGVSPDTRPFTEVTTDVGHNYTGTVIAQGNGHQAGLGDMEGFDAVFTGQMVVAAAGPMTFDFFSDDGFQIGIGGGASYVSGAMWNPTPTSPLMGYPVVGAFNLPSSPTAREVTINFPSAGVFPYEVDYTECCGGTLALTMATQSGTVPPAGTISITPLGTVTDDIGTQQHVSASVLDAGGQPITGLPVSLTVSGPNDRTLSAVTNASGIAAFAYSGSSAGTDSLSAAALVSGMPAISSTAFVTWSIPAVPAAPTPAPIAYEEVVNPNGAAHTTGLGLGSATSWSVSFPSKTGLVADARCVDPSTQATTSRKGSAQPVAANATSWSGAFDQTCVSPQVLSLRLVQLNDATKGVDDPSQTVLYDIYVNYTGPVGSSAGATPTPTPTQSTAPTPTPSAGPTTPAPTPSSTGTPAPTGSTPPVVVTTAPSCPDSPGVAAAGTPGIVADLLPSDGSRLTAPTPVTATVTAPAGRCFVSWSVTEASDVAGSRPIVLSSGTGTPPALLATFDPTVLSDGEYDITVTVATSGGGVAVSSTTVVVDGNLKLGRFAATWHDTDASLGSTTLGMLRSYDSTVKHSGDFGYGWSLSTSGIKVSTNGALGDGGWSAYDSSCVFTLCTTAYRTSTPHVVVVTFPDGHVETFDFTPQGGQDTYWLAYARFTARPGTTSTLTPVGDDNLLDQGDGSLYDEDSGDAYTPTQFVLTTHDGNKLLLDTTQGLVSFTNPAGITYTFTPTGVTSSAGGNTEVFTRDSTGRITDIKADGHTSYSYSAAGDLASVTDPSGAVTTFTYDGAHLLLSVNGPGNVPLRTMHYDTAGRLTSVTDADGNTTAMTDDVAARTQVIKDPNGKLTTTLPLDDLGDVLTKTAVGDGQTRTTTSTYDAFGRVLSSTDPLGHSTSRTYDDVGDLLTATDAAGHVRAITYGSTGQPLTTTDATGGVQQFGYDGSGELTSLTDANGHTTGYSYDAAGRMASKTDAFGGTTSYGYDGAGRVTSSTDPLGRTTTTTYDSHGHVATSTNPAGLVTTTSYDPDGRLLSTTDPSGEVTKSVYDSNGRQTSMTDALGKVTSYAYTAAGLRSTSTDPLGRATAFAYDADGRVTTTTDPTGAATTSAYDAFGELASVKDPLGRVTGYGYDAAGERTSMTAANGKTTSYGFDVAGNRTTVTDPLGHVTTTGFDAMNRPTTVTDPDGHVTKTAYLPGGQASAVTDPAGGVAKYVYDADNRVTSTTDALSETSSSVFDAAGQLTSSVDAAGRGSSSTYDGDGRLLTSTDGAGRVTSYAYDSAGRLASVTSPSGRVTSYGYDADGRQTSVTDNLGHTTATAYDAAGETASTTDPNGHTTFYGYDSAGRVTSMTDALGGKVSLGYDAAGQQTKVTDPDGVVHSYGYDALGDRSSVTDALGNVQSWVFDDAGQLKTAKNARGQATTYSYDAAGQTTGWSSPDGTVSQGFDALGDRTSVSDATGSSSYTFDAVGRMTGASTPAGTVTYGYDASGLRTSVTAAGAHVGYAYDGAGQLASVADASGTTSMGYTTDGDLASVTRPNGVATAYGYDAAGRLVKDDTAKGSTVVANIDYTLDAAGNRVGVSGPDGAQSFTLDADNRLTAATGGGATNLAYSYDAAGNRTSTTSGTTTTGYTYDAAGRLSKVGAAAVSMDADGNLTTAGGDTYTYNAAGALTAATVGGKAATYTVNADGARVAVTTGGATSKLILDVTSDLPAVLAETGHRYTRDTSGGLLADTAGSTTSYAVTDAQGTVRALTSSTGAVTGTASYDPYGQLRTSTGTATTFGYTGAATDVGGNVNLQAREYNPTYGQFLQSDTYTVGGPGTTGYNHYTYTSDNPATQVDPTGHDTALDAGTAQVVADELPAENGSAALGALAAAETSLLSTSLNLAAAAAIVACNASDVCTAEELERLLDPDPRRAKKWPPTGTTVKDPDPGSDQMRIQLQEGFSTESSSVAWAPAGAGVTTAQLLASLYTTVANARQAVVRSSAGVAVTKTVVWIQNRPPLGVSAIGEVHDEEFVARGRTWRIDVDNLRGTNLKE